MRGFRVFPTTPRGVGFFFRFPNRVGPNGSAYVRRGKVSLHLRADSTGNGGGEAARDKGCGAACCKRFTVRGVTIRGVGLQQGHALARPANPGLQTEVPNPKPKPPTLRLKPYILNHVAHASRVFLRRQAKEASSKRRSAKVQTGGGGFLQGFPLGVP